MATFSTHLSLQKDRCGILLSAMMEKLEAAIAPGGNSATYCQTNENLTWSRFGRFKLLNFRAYLTWLIWNKSVACSYINHILIGNSNHTIYRRSVSLRDLEIHCLCQLSSCQVFRCLKLFPRAGASDRQAMASKGVQWNTQGFARLTESLDDRML